MRNLGTDGIETIKSDTADAVDELKERAKAGGEKLNRAVKGDDMPVGDRIGSHVKEMGHDLRADLDRSKRDVRHETLRDEDGI